MTAPEEDGAEGSANQIGPTRPQAGQLATAASRDTMITAPQVEQRIAGPVGDVFVPGTGPDVVCLRLAPVRSLALPFASTRSELHWGRRGSRVSGSCHPRSGDVARGS